MADTWLLHDHHNRGDHQHGSDDAHHEHLAEGRIIWHGHGPDWTEWLLMAEPTEVLHNDGQASAPSGAAEEAT